jgi:hypothetical protein
VRMIRAESGELLAKSVRIKIFTPGNKRAVTRVHLAGSGRGIGVDGVDGLLKRTADKIEQQWPAEEYSLVQVGPFAFNFVWRASQSEQHAS